MCSKIEILVYVDMLVHTARICRLKVKLMISSSTAQPSLLKSRECGSGRYLLRDILRLCNHYLGGLFLEIPLFRWSLLFRWRGLLDDSGGPCKPTFLSNKVVLGLIFIINNDYLFVVLYFRLIGLGDTAASYEVLETII